MDNSHTLFFLKMKLWWKWFIWIEWKKSELICSEGRQKDGKKTQIQQKKSEKNSTFRTTFFNQFRIEKSSVIIFRPKNVNLDRVSTKVREIPWQQNFKNKSLPAFLLGSVVNINAKKQHFHVPTFLLMLCNFKSIFLVPWNDTSSPFDSKLSSIFVELNPWKKDIYTIYTYICRSTKSFFFLRTFFCPDPLQSCDIVCTKVYSHRRHFLKRRKRRGLV